MESRHAVLASTVFLVLSRFETEAMARAEPPRWGNQVERVQTATASSLSTTPDAITTTAFPVQGSLQGNQRNNFLFPEQS